jgi:hypothetical protein
MVQGRVQRRDLVNTIMEPSFRVRVISKRGTRKIHREQRKSFVTTLERDVTKTTPITCNILRKLKGEIKRHVENRNNTWKG